MSGPIVAGTGVMTFTTVVAATAADDHQLRLGGLTYQQLGRA